MVTGCLKSPGANAQKGVSYMISLPGQRKGNQVTLNQILDKDLDDLALTVGVIGIGTLIVGIVFFLIT